MLNRLSVLGICSLFLLMPSLAGAELAGAETLYEAMTRTYRDNPDILAARAGLRAIDENVAIAKAGQRPVLSAEVQGSVSDVEGKSSNQSRIGLNLSQSVFDGFKTENSIRAAHKRVLAGRQSLLSSEMDILIKVVQSYADVLLHRKISDIRRQNLEFLDAQLKSAQARLKVGEGTRTEIAQAQASLAAAIAQFTAAKTRLKASEAVYKQVTGLAPGHLAPPHLAQKILPFDLNEALMIAVENHPALRSARLSIDAAEYDVKIRESALLPGVNLTGSLTETDKGATTAKIGVRLTIPLYGGGANAARIRQSKEQLGHIHIKLDKARRQLEQIVISAWVNLQSSKATITANEAEVRAARLALSGVLEERKAGQRTTLDVLNAQSKILNAQEALVLSKRGLTVATYNVLYSMGKLTTESLGLKIARYDPQNHYNAVEDKWFGLRTITE